MNEERYFSRARLRRDASIQALLPLLAPAGGQGSASHALVWSLFADDPDRTRDFLYREAAPGTLYILSARPPRDPHRLFDLETKPWALDIVAGDRLTFSLRANPVVRRKVAGAKHAKKDDVVMHALHQAAGDKPRPERRAELIDEHGKAWLGRIAPRSGFTPIASSLSVDGYQQHRLARPDRSRPIRFSTLDFEGRLTISDPDVFRAATNRGFGHARAFGCGLMLLRRG